MTLIRRFFALVFFLPALTSVLHLTPKGVVDGLLLAAIGYLWLPRPDRERLHRFAAEQREQRRPLLERARHDLERAFAAPAHEPQPAATPPVDFAPGARHPFGPPQPARPALPVARPLATSTSEPAGQGAAFFRPRVEQIHDELSNGDGWPYGPHSLEEQLGDWPAS